MSELVDIPALLTVAAVTFLGANALVLFFGLTLVGLGRYSEARSNNQGGLSYAAVAILAAAACVALLVAGLLAILGH